MKKGDKAELFDGCFSPLITDCVSPFGVCVCVCLFRIAFTFVGIGSDVLFNSKFFCDYAALINVPLFQHV